jgi:hypothetical protein
MDQISVSSNDNDSILSLSSDDEDDQNKDTYESIQKANSAVKEATDELIELGKKKTTVEKAKEKEYNADEVVKKAREKAYNNLSKKEKAHTEAQKAVTEVQKAVTEAQKAVDEITTTPAQNEKNSNKNLKIYLYDVSKIENQKISYYTATVENYDINKLSSLIFNKDIFYNKYQCYEFIKYSNNTSELHVYLWWGFDVLPAFYNNKNQIMFPSQPTSIDIGLIHVKTVKNKILELQKKPKQANQITTNTTIELCTYIYIDNQLKQYKLTSKNIVNHNPSIVILKNKSILATPHIFNNNNNIEIAYVFRIDSKIPNNIKIIIDGNDYNLSKFTEDKTFSYKPVSMSSVIEQIKEVLSSETAKKIETENAKITELENANTELENAKYKLENAKYELGIKENYFIKAQEYYKSILKLQPTVEEVKKSIKDVEKQIKDTDDAKRIEEYKKQLSIKDITKSDQDIIRIYQEQEEAKKNNHYFDNIEYVVIHGDNNNNKRIVSLNEKKVNINSIEIFYQNTNQYLKYSEIPFDFHAINNIILLKMPFTISETFNYSYVDNYNKKNFNLHTENDPEIIKIVDEFLKLKKEKDEEEKKEKLEYIIFVVHDGSQFVKKYIKVDLYDVDEHKFFLSEKEKAYSTLENYGKIFKFYKDNKTYNYIIINNINMQNYVPIQSIKYDKKEYGKNDIKPANAEINLILKNIFDTNRFFQSTDDDSGIDISKLNNLLIIFNHIQNSNDSKVICYELAESSTAPFTVISKNGSTIQSNDNNLINLTDNVQIMFVSNVDIKEVKDTTDNSLAPKSDDEITEDNIKQYLYKYFNIGKVNKMLRA